MRMNKKHYRTRDGGRTWIPKQAFDSEKDINRVQFPEHKYIAYECDECGKFHLGSVDKFHLSNVTEFLARESNVTSG